MALLNTRDTYGWATILLHWITAFGVIAMFATGFLAEQVGESQGRDAARALMRLHFSIGMTLFVFFAARIVLHYVQQRPEMAPGSAFLHRVAVAVHHLLLLGLLIQIISGPLAIWSGGRAIDVFGVVSLASPFAERNEGVHEVAEIAHAVGRWTIIAALSLHVLGAFKHLLIDRDGVFLRMLWPRPLRKTS
jgi:cytochrome b561